MGDWHTLRRCHGWNDLCRESRLPRFRPWCDLVSILDRHFSALSQAVTSVVAVVVLFQAGPEQLLCTGTARQKPHRRHTPCELHGLKSRRPQGLCPGLSEPLDCQILATLRLGLTAPSGNRTEGRCRQQVSTSHKEDRRWRHRRLRQPARRRRRRRRHPSAPSSVTQTTNAP